MLGERYCRERYERQEKYRIAVEARGEVNAQKDHHERYRKKVEHIPERIKKCHLTKAPLKSTYLSVESFFLERLIGIIFPFIMINCVAVYLAIYFKFTR